VGKKNYFFFFFNVRDGERLLRSRFSLFKPLKIFRTRSNNRRITLIKSKISRSVLKSSHISHHLLSVVLWAHHLSNKPVAPSKTEVGFTGSAHPYRFILPNNLMKNNNLQKIVYSGTFVKIAL
jgi:hypothetical protein